MKKATQNCDEAVDCLSLL